MSLDEAEKCNLSLKDAHDELDETTELEDKSRIFNQIKQYNKNAKYENYKDKSINQMLVILQKYRDKAQNVELEKDDEVIKPEIKYGKNGGAYIRNDAGGYTKVDDDYFESFNITRGGKGYLVEASMGQLKRTTLSEDPTRAKKSKNVHSKYIGISKYGVLNFETTSETYSGVKWYQEVHFPSFSGFMNIVENGDEIEAVDVKKVMSQDNIKISCFTEDTLVQTDSGEKKIKDVVPGDKVITHTGNYQKVIQTFENDYKGELIEINGVKSTPNHPYLVKLPTGEIQWVMACEITKDMKLLEIVEEI